MPNQFTKVKWIILAALTVGLGTVPIWGTDYAMLFFMLFCIYLALAQMWNLLAGYSGLISLGQQSFVGLGGYTLAVLNSYYGINIWIGAGLGGLASVLLALFMSLFIFRMKGVYFAIGTWIFAEALLVWFSNWAYVKYGSGLFIKPTNEFSMEAIYYAAFVVGAGSVALVYILLRSRLGLGLMAMRDDDQVSDARRSVPKTNTPTNNTRMMYPSNVAPTWRLAIPNRAFLLRTIVHLPLMGRHLSPKSHQI